MKSKRNGYDVGNYSLKVAPNLNIKSLVSTEENLLGSSLSLTLDGITYYIGEGSFETELNKSMKENFLPLLLTGIALSSSPEEAFHQVVCGLPINQYKANREALEEQITGERVRHIILNKDKPNESRRDIIITDCKVYPEGVGAYYSLDTERDAIMVDIGGRTTDIAFISDKKLKISSTVAVGTLNIYKDICDTLNSNYGLDLTIPMVDRIIERGFLQVDGKDTDLRFITDILKQNFLKIKEDLDLKFPARTEMISLVGGGAKLFEKAFVKRYQACEVAPNPVYANAIGFSKVGEMMWG